MMKTKRVLCAVCVLVLVLAAFYPISASSLTLQEEWDAQKYSYTNPDTGYQAKIMDPYSLLSEEEGSRLLEEMIPLTEYGNIGFCSFECSTYKNDTREQAIKAKKQLFGEDSKSSVFAIGKLAEQSGSYFMATGRREALICKGTIAKYISYSKSEEIVTGVEQYVDSAQYYKAASEVFRQMAEIIAEGSAVDPLRYPSGAAISLVLGLIIAITLAFLTRFNPGIRKSDDRLNIPSQKSDLRITKNQMISRRIINKSK